MRDQGSKEQDQDCEADQVDLKTLNTASMLALQGMNQFLRLFKLYDPANQVFTRSVQDLDRALHGLMQMLGSEEVEFCFEGSRIFVNLKGLRPKARQIDLFKFLAQYFQRRRLMGIRFLSRVDPKGLRVFLTLLIESADAEDPVASIQKGLKAQGISDILIIPAQGDGSTGEQVQVEDRELTLAALYVRLQKFLETVFDNWELAQNFELTPIANTINELALLSDDELVHMLRLLSIKQYDRPLAYRSVNATFLIAAWAASLRLPPGVIQQVAAVASLHTLPFVLKPDHVVGAPLPLELRVAVYQGLQRLQKIWPTTSFDRLVVIEVHEPFGNNGTYARESAACYQHIFSRMLRIVMMFEAMTTWPAPFERERQVFLPEEAIAELAKPEVGCDPTLVKLFTNWLGVYPVGTPVLLTTGEVGQVFAAASDPLRFQRPIVKIIKDASGQSVRGERLIDLNEMNEKLGTYKRSIRKSVTWTDVGVEPKQVPMVK